MYTTAAQKCEDLKCNASNEGYEYDFFSKKYYCEKHFTSIMREKNNLLKGYPAVITIERQLVDIIRDPKVSYFTRKIKEKDKINAYLEYFFDESYDYFEIDLNILLPKGYVFKLMCDGECGYIYDIIEIDAHVIAASPLCNSERIAKLCALIMGWKFMLKPLKFIN